VVRATWYYRRVSVWGTVVVAAVVFLSSCAPIHAQQTCANPDEVTALEARILQTELMVAALTCKSHQQYNDFVRNHAQELQSMDSRLRGMFERFGRAEKADDLGQLVTRVANEAAIRAAKSTGQYCQEMGAIFKLSLTAEPGQLASLTIAQPFSRRHNVRSCQADANGALGIAQPVTR
jgi:hypothetical protein